MSVPWFVNLWNVRLTFTVLSTSHSTGGFGSFILSRNSKILGSRSTRTEQSNIESVNRIDWVGNHMVKSLAAARSAQVFCGRKIEMKKVIFNIFLVICVVGVAFAQSVESEIREFAAQEYPNDARMRQYVYNKQISAYRYMPFRQRCRR